MKTKSLHRYIVTSFAALCLCASAVNLSAQTVATPAVTPMTISNLVGTAGSTNSTGLAHDLERVAVDLWHIGGGLATPGSNSVYTLRLGAGENTSTHEKIEAAMLTMATTNGTGVGIVGAHIGSQWKYGGATVTLGRTDKWGFIGNVQEFIGDGVIYDFRTHDPANYFLTGFEKSWDINGKISIGLGVTADNRSNTKGIDVLAGANGTARF